ncbi:hypothetical protein H9642_06365 [Pseudomonadaceae bacterium Sa2CUA2]|uniref:Uncharacterized protein n=2 Tax=Serpens gallinarum TaxID=2763075 RepID=A0ABR8TM16_9PSED|nr:hypothetical protein [Serpens gallinarum]
MFVLNNWAIKPANDYLFENKIASLEEQGYMTKIATTLSHYLGNPNGTELVCILGSGEEKNNHQALNTWVAYHSKEIFELRLEGVNPLEYLKEKLESQLNN